MGCSSSKESHDGDHHPRGARARKEEPDPAGAAIANYLPTTGPLTAKDYKSRLASSEGTQTLYFPHSRITIRYAFVSQRGYYPDCPDKANQDSLCIHTHFGGDPEQAFFGVFDGHGEHGTQCSQFAKDKVPENMLNNSHFHVSPEIAYHRSMVLTNNQLHRQPDVDDSMSGTTAIALLLRSRMAYIANVGDSRAVLAERQGDRLVAQDLSFDQTPFRRDECERVKRCGARVLTLDQLEGLKDPNVEYWGTEEDNDGDPPRLWAPNATYPGTAFTRSIGDSAAERIGVFAEPEVVTKQLQPSHAFMVLASDGVWEFLPSQSVVDMVSKFDDPQEAALSVVAESYRLWLQHETRTDDITMVVIQFQGLEDTAMPMSLPTPIGAMMDYAARPGLAAGMKRMPTLRMPAIESPSLTPHLQLQPLMLGGGAGDAINPASISLEMQQPHQPDPYASPRDKQRSALGGASTSGLSFSSTTGGAGKSKQVLSDDERQMLEEAVEANFLFANMNDTERNTVFEAMQKVPVKAGQLIIRQGDPGDHFYVVDSGLYDVYLQQTPTMPPELVHTYGLQGNTGGGEAGPSKEEESQPHPSFGELALLYSKPRAATVVARTDGVLWSLHRNDYKAALLRASLVCRLGMEAASELTPHELRNLVRTLRGVEVLQCLSGSQLQDLAEAMEVVSVEDGQYVIRQGEEGSEFFLIQSGEVVCTVRKNPSDSSEVPKEVLRLAAGQYFGERALLSSAKRAANVIAHGRVKLLKISRAQFEIHMGLKLQAVIDAENEWRSQLAMQREVLARKNATAVHLQAAFSLDDLVAKGLLFSTDCSALMLMEHRASEEIFTVRVTSVADVAMLGKQALVMRARDITRSLEPSFFVPGVLKSFKDERVLAEVLGTVGLCTLDMLLAHGPFDEVSAVFVAASIVLGLEHLHWSHVVFRGLSVHSVIVTEGGQVQLVDFRFARKDDGRAYTLCGNPEYLAPEIIESRGHSGAADLWALGVLIFCLLTGETPFAAPGDDELRIYRRICAGVVELPEGLSQTAIDLISGLLAYDPSSRLGAGPLGLAALKQHPWFAPVNWDALLEHRFPPPAGIRERIYNFEGVAYAHFEPHAFDGDMRWMENF